jgi:hypothetical protein
MRSRILGSALAALALGGCAVAPLSVPQPSLENIQAIRAGGLPALSVGDFTPGPGRPTEMDKTIQARGGIDSAPEGSFAKYLADTLQAELKGAGRLDPDSPLQVSGVITDTKLVSEIGTPTAKLTARFTLTKSGRQVFTKELTASATWDWQYLADIAVPDAFNHYAGLFPQLVGQLLADPDFQTAAKAP